MSPEAPRGEEAEAARWAWYLPYEDRRVVRNIPGYDNYAEWREAEYLHTADTLAGIKLGEVTVEPTFDVDHARAAHKALFDGFYEWAGDIRTVDIFKGEGSFAGYEDIESNLRRAQRAFTRFQDNPGDREHFVTATAEAATRWNHAHPFREGNGRTMKLILDQFAETTPWQFDYDRVSKEVWNRGAELSLPSRDNNYVTQPDEFRAVFDQITVDRPDQHVPETDAQERLNQLGLSASEYDAIQSRLAGSDPSPQANATTWRDGWTGVRPGSQQDSGATHEAGHEGDFQSRQRLHGPQQGGHESGREGPSR